MSQKKNKGREFTIDLSDDDDYIDLGSNVSIVVASPELPISKIKCLKFVTFSNGIWKCHKRKNKWPSVHHQSGWWWWWWIRWYWLRRWFWSPSDCFAGGIDRSIWSTMCWTWAILTIMMALIWFRWWFFSRKVGPVLSPMTTEPFSTVGPKLTVSASNTAAQFPNLNWFLDMLVEWYLFCDNWWVVGVFVCNW